MLKLHVMHHSVDILGHSDAVMGAAILNDDGLCQRLRFLQNGRIFIGNAYYIEKKNDKL